MKTKLMMAVAAVAFVLMVMKQGFAAVEEIDGVKWYYQYNSQIPVGHMSGLVVAGAEIIAGDVTYSGNLTIPTTLGGYLVRSIAASAFADCKSLVSVQVPDCVVYVGRNGFRGAAVHSLSFADGLKIVEEAAFSECKSLVEVVLPDSLIYLGRALFYQDDKLKRVRWPGSVAAIRDSSFCRCRELESIDLPEGVTLIESDCFRECTNLKHIGLPSSLENIGNNAFYDVGGRVEEIVLGEECKAFKVAEGCLVSSDGKILYIAPGACENLKIPEGIKVIPERALEYGSFIHVELPSSLTTIGNYSFYSCKNLKSVTIPEGVTSIGYDAFYYCNSIDRVVFLGPPAGSLSGTGLPGYGQVSFPRKYGAQWQELMGLNSFNGFAQANHPNVEIISAGIRKDDATVLDVVYKVKSEKPTVRVRALAFQDGTRSFAKVVRVTELIDGTDVNVGDNVSANVEHAVSWRVSSDWKIDLAKVKFEVLAVEDDLLPLELTTIPKTSKHQAMEVSWNVVTKEQLFDALLWLYADGAEDLKLKDGVLTSGTTELANGDSLSWKHWTVYEPKYHEFSYYYAAPYVFSKMGFKMLEGEELEYANYALRLDFEAWWLGHEHAYRLIEQ